MEPAVSAHRLTTKLKYEIAIMICAERQPDIHEVYMVLAAIVGRTDGMPYRQDLRMDNGVRLLPRGHKPQIRIVAGIDHSTASDNPLVF